MVEHALSSQTSDEPHPLTEAPSKSKYGTLLDDALHGSIASIPELNNGPSSDAPTFVLEEKEAPRMARRRGSRLVQEWKEEEDVRNMYQVPPPAALYDDTERNNDDDSVGGLEVLTQPGLLRHFSREIWYGTEDSGKRTTARGELEALLHGN